jgi:hypothetical protein
VGSTMAEPVPVGAEIFSMSILGIRYVALKTWWWYEKNLDNESEVMEIWTIGR